MASISCISQSTPLGQPHTPTRMIEFVRRCIREQWKHPALSRYFLLTLLATFGVACADSGNETFRIEGRSMEPSFQAGQTVEFKKFATSALRRNDILVFEVPSSPERRLMKRIVALPGEQIEIRNGVVIIDGQEIREPDGVQRGIDSMTPPVLKSGEFFVLGDNRPMSNDSRHWGPLNADDIVGRVLVDNNHPSKVE